MLLADASAVQFTRNPEGIAGALKKIGGFEQGSRIENPSAPEASHAFFANGLAAGLTSVFSTHPALEERIRRLDPSFLPAEGAPATQSMTAEAGAAAFAGTDGRVSRAAQAVGHIGSPTPAHVSYVASLRDGLPARVVDAAHDPYAARALVYALLCAAEPGVRAHQLEEFRSLVDPAVARETEELLTALASESRAAHLPLVDMSLPALQELTQDQYREFKHVVSVLMAADGRIDLFEWTLQRVLLAHLVPCFERQPRQRVRFSGLRRLHRQLSVALSTLAQVHPENESRVRAAFDAGRVSLGVDGLVLLPREECGLGALDAALIDLADVTPKLKRPILTACAEIVLSDEHVSIEETELLRAVSDSLGCPMPPLLLGSAR